MILVASTANANKLDKYLENLSGPQLAVMYRTFYTAKVHDLHWTMTAIAWKESEFGLNLVGRTTPDYGVFQINIKTYRNRFSDYDGLKDELTNNYSLGFSAALAEIEYWKSVHGSNWNKVWASYNSGWTGGKGYSDSIKLRIKALKKCNKFMFD